MSDLGVMAFWQAVDEERVRFRAQAMSAREGQDRHGLEAEGPPARSSQDDAPDPDRNHLTTNKGATE